MALWMSKRLAASGPVLVVITDKLLWDIVHVVTFVAVQYRIKTT